MSNLKPVPIREAWIADANELLHDAIDAEFETVVVLGYKNGRLHVKQSCAVDFAKMLGMLELAKFQLMDNLDGLSDHD